MGFAQILVGYPRLPIPPRQHRFGEGEPWWVETQVTQSLTRTFPTAATSWRYSNSKVVPDWCELYRIVAKRRFTQALRVRRAGIAPRHLARFAAAVVPGALKRGLGRAAKPARLVFKDFRSVIP